MAFDPTINDNRVLGNNRIFAFSSLASIDASQGLNIEPAQAILGSFFAKAAAQLGLGRVQSIFLLNIYLTAATAVIIYWICRLSGYSNLTSYSLGMLFGLCTSAWPYTQTYFRDSVAMFFLSISWGAYLLIISEKYKIDRYRYIRIIFWITLFFGLWLGILSKNTIAFVIPVITVSIIQDKFIDQTKSNQQNKSFKYLAKGITALAFVSIIILIWIFFLPADGIFSRFTFSYYQTVLQKIVNNPHPQLIQAIAGPILSPSKSIFLYSPILLLSIFSLFKFFKKSWPAWFYLILLIIGQGLFYDSDWWGYVNWGLRYLLPAIPLLLISSAPIVDKILSSQKGLQKLFLIGSFSLLPQLIGILAPVKQYYIAMANSIPSISNNSAIWNPRYMPLWWHLKWILSNGFSDLAITRIGLWSLPLIILLLIILCCSLLLARFRHKLLYAIIILTVSILSSGLMLTIYRLDPANQSRSDFEKSQKTIQEYYLQDDIIIVKSYGAQAWSYWMNWGDPELKWISLPYYFPNQSTVDKYLLSNDPTLAPNNISQKIIENAGYNYERIWLFLPDDSPGGNLNWEVNYLSNLRYLQDHWIITGDGHSTHLYLFNLSNN